MAQEVIDTGTLPNDGKGDTLRVAGQKINNNFTQLFNSGTVSDNTARQRANAAFDTANTKIAKAGDTVTGSLIFRTNANNAYPNTKIGNIYEANSLDIFAENETDFVQLNWGNSNFAIVDSVGITLATSNTTVEVKNEEQKVFISASTNGWSFDTNGRITLFNSATAERSIFAPGFRNTVLVTNTTFNASNTNDVIFGDTFTANANVNVNLSANADVGKTFTIKNIGESAFFVRVNGTERAYPYIEDPSTGTFVNTVLLENIPGDGGQCHTWVFQGGVYRAIT